MNIIWLINNASTDRKAFQPGYGKLFFEQFISIWSNLACNLIKFKISNKFNKMQSLNHYIYTIGHIWPNSALYSHTQAIMLTGRWWYLYIDIMMLLYTYIYDIYMIIFSFKSMRNSKREVYMCICSEFRILMIRKNYF